MQLEVSTPPNWHNAQDAASKSNVTLRRGEGTDAGLLQMSLALYRGGQIPNPSAQDLERQARDYGGKIGYGEPRESSSGSCALGLYGTAVFLPSARMRAQLWFVSNGRDFVLVSYVCPAAPATGEVAEAQAIVSGMTLRTP